MATTDIIANQVRQKPTQLPKHKTSDRLVVSSTHIMPFSFSFSSSVSAVSVASGSANGHGGAKGWAYKRESYSNNHGSGVRTTKQKLGEAPVTQTKIYDAQGRPLYLEGGRRRTPGVDDRVPRIEDVTDDPDLAVQGRVARK